MKIKLLTLWESSQAIAEIKVLSFNAIKSYKLCKLFDEIQTELNQLEKVRKELVKKHGKPDEKGDISILPSEPAFKIILTEFNALLDEEVDLKHLNDDVKINLDDLKNCEIKPGTLQQLDWLTNLDESVDVE